MKNFSAKQVDRAKLLRFIKFYSISQKNTLAGIHKVKDHTLINKAIKTDKYPTLLKSIVTTVTRILNKKYELNITEEFFLFNSQISLTNKTANK